MKNEGTRISQKPQRQFAVRSVRLCTHWASDTALRKVWKLNKGSAFMNSTLAAWYLYIAEQIYHCVVIYNFHGHFIYMYVFYSFPFQVTIKTVFVIHLSFFPDNHTPIFYFYFVILFMMCTFNSMPIKQFVQEYTPLWIFSLALSFFR